MKNKLSHASTFFKFCLIVLGIGVAGCSTVPDRSHSTESNPATLTPFNNEWGVSIFIDELDGETVSYGELERLLLDEGNHDLRVRIEHQPSSGSSVIVGGLGNLLMRAGSNKTFRHDISVDLVAGHNYGLTVKGTEAGFELLVFDETEGGVVILEQEYEYKDGDFERIF